MAYHSRWMGPTSESCDAVDTVEIPVMGRAVGDIGGDMVSRPCPYDEEVPQVIG